MIKTKKNNIDWWNPTKVNQEWISNLKKNNTKLFTKIKWKIQFELDVIIINWMKFHNVPLDFNLNFDDANKEALKIKWRRLPTKDEFQKLFDLFTVDWKYNEDDFKELFSIINWVYWSHTSYAVSTLSSWISYFWDRITFNDNNTDSLEVLCIYE